MYKEGEVRIPSGCAISAVISRYGNKMTGEKIIESMIPMHDRSNGLGGGFAAYGIYPDHKDEYALHIFFNDKYRIEECERILKDNFEITKAEIIPTRKSGQRNAEGFRRKQIRIIKKPCTLPRCRKWLPRTTWWSWNPRRRCSGRFQAIWIRQNGKRNVPKRWSIWN